MKIGTALVSSDLNPRYLDFFPLVHEVWNKLIGIRCVLALVAHEVPDDLSDWRDDIILFPPIPDVNDSLQSQCIRLLAPQLFAGPEAVLISDIDMLPMCKNYFVDNVASASDDAFVVYRSDAIEDRFKEIAMCYNAASPETWGRITQHVVRGVSDAQDIVKHWASTVSYSGTHGGQGWTTDQLLLYKFVGNPGDVEVMKLTDKATGFRRLDRSQMRWRANSAQIAAARRHEYSDYHMLRPMAKYRDANNEIAAAVLGRNYRPRRIRAALQRLFA